MRHREETERGYSREEEGVTKRKMGENDERKEKEEIRRR
jgi:hypothetical protein